MLFTFVFFHYLTSSMRFLNRTTDFKFLLSLWAWRLHAEFVSKIIECMPISISYIYKFKRIIKRALKGGSYSHFPAQILTKSHRPTLQIPSWLCLSCSNLNPIPIFYCFFVDESQSQCMKSHFPSQKMGKSQFPFYPFRTLYKAFRSL